MPFEPLQTDEKMAQGAPREKTMDDLMLAGCTGFVATSLLSFGLGVWPFFVFIEETGWLVLLRTFALGLIPSVGLGIFATRRFGLAGACGFVGGALAVAIFLLLNTNRLLNAAALARTPQPFPPVMVYILPVVWILVVLTCALIALPKREWPGHDE